MLDYTTLLQHHLAGNCYPPVNAMFVPLAARAIEAVKDGAGDALLPAPGETRITATSVVDAFNLHAFTATDNGR